MTYFNPENPLTLNFPLCLNQDLLDFRINKIKSQSSCKSFNPVNPDSDIPTPYPANDTPSR
jgi:hypothetical protein